MKVYKYPKGYFIKRKNKRLVIRKNDTDNTVLVQIAIFQKGEGHFAVVESKRGIKSLIMRLSEETAETLSVFLLEHLQNQKEK